MRVEALGKLGEKRTHRFLFRVGCNFCGSKDVDCNSTCEEFDASLHCDKLYLRTRVVSIHMSCVLLFQLFKAES